MVSDYSFLLLLALLFLFLFFSGCSSILFSFSKPTCLVTCHNKRPDFCASLTSWWFLHYDARFLIYYPLCFRWISPDVTSSIRKHQPSMDHDLCSSLVFCTTVNAECLRLNAVTCADTAAREQSVSMLPRRFLLDQQTSLECCTYDLPLTA